jgi:hypothetical protein
MNVELVNNYRNAVYRTVKCYNIWENSGYVPNSKEGYDYYDSIKVTQKFLNYLYTVLNTKELTSVLLNLVEEMNRVQV